VNDFITVAASDSLAFKQASHLISRLAPLGLPSEAREPLRITRPEDGTAQLLPPCRRLPSLSPPSIHRRTMPAEKVSSPPLAVRTFQETTVRFSPDCIEEELKECFRNAISHQSQQSSALGSGTPERSGGVACSRSGE
jgi:hypothetical protein